MHILESMASVGRLKIGKPFISPKFYPLAFEKYITVHSGAKFNSRKYGYWNEALSFIKPILDKEGIKIVQIGGKDDEPLKFVDTNLCGQVSFRQTYYVIQNALLHVGVDSLPVHIASAVGTKIVALYCNMYASQSKPYWTKESDCILLESHRNGLKPSYAAEESPKTIDLIKPEQIAQSILKLLNLDATLAIETVYCGDMYKNVFLETVPDQVVNPAFNKDVLLQIRYDYVQANPNTENVVYNQLSVRKCTLVTDKPLNAEVLKQLRNNIVQIIFIVKDNTHIKFVKALVAAGIPLLLVSYLPKEQLNTLKLDYADLGLIAPQESTSKESLKLTDKVNYEHTKIRTNRFILSNGKVFFSKAHWTLGEPMIDFNTNTITLSESVDNNELWEDAAAFFIYNE